MAYPPRPGPSPVVATLFAAGVLDRRMRILDVGCGAGMDAVALGLWGARRVVGIDLDRRALASARRRAARAGVADRVAFVEVDVRRLGERFPPGSFEAVVDTLLLNNLRKKAIEEYAREVAAVLRPGGLLALSERVTLRAHTNGGEDVLPHGPLAGRFRFGPTVGTHIPEVPLGRSPPYARVAVSVGRKR